MLRQVLPWAALAQLAAADCPVASLPVAPVTDVVLANGNTMRGVQVEIGTPRVNFSMIPYLGLNNSWVWDPTCNFASAAACYTYRGGEYVYDKSTSSAGPLSVAAAGAARGDIEAGTNTTNSAFNPSDRFTTDTWSIGSSVLPTFPFGVLNSSIFSSDDLQGFLGFGYNSTILNALTAAKKVASRSWSYWYGHIGVPKGVKDGHFVAGGYDANIIVASSNYTRRLSRSSEVSVGQNYYPCLIQSKITGLTLNFPDGTTQNIMNGMNPLVTCLDPQWDNIVGLPAAQSGQGYWQAFNEAAEMGASDTDYNGAFGITYTDDSYPTSKIFNGSMTIELDSQFTVTFPNELLVIPAPELSNSGEITYNSTYSKILVTSLGDDTSQTSFLGRYFLQQAYLNVNYETDSYSLYNINTTAATSNFVQQGGNCTSSNTNSTSPGTIPSATSPPSSSSNSLSGGAIAGIVIGSIAGVALVAGAVFFVLRRRRQQATATVPGQSEFGRDSGLPPAEQKPFLLDKSELDANDAQKQELPASSSAGFHVQDFKSGQSELDGAAAAPVHELPVPVQFHELPSER